MSLGRETAQGKVPDAPIRGPESKSQHLCKEQGVVVYAYNSRSGEGSDRQITEAPWPVNCSCCFFFLSL